MFDEKMPQISWNCNGPAIFIFGAYPICIHLISCPMCHTTALEHLKFQKPKNHRPVKNFCRLGHFFGHKHYTKRSLSGLKILYVNSKCFHAVSMDVSWWKNNILRVLAYQLSCLGATSIAQMSHTNIWNCWTNMKFTKNLVIQKVGMMLITKLKTFVDHIEQLSYSLKELNFSLLVCACLGQKLENDPPVISSFIRTVVKHLQEHWSS